MNAVTVTFLTVVAAIVALRAWLAVRQVAHLGGHRSDIPAAFRSSLPGELHAKATDYAIAKTRLELAAGCLDALIVLAWTLGGGLDLLDRAWRGSGFPTPVAGALVVASSLLLAEVFRLPAAAYRLFAVDRRFGLNRATPALFLADAARKGGLLIAVSLPLAALALWLMTVAGAFRWFAVWGVWAAFQLAGTWAYPALVAPLFNRLAPLPDGDLKSRIARLMARSGHALADVMVMDGSRRSSHANAHVAGLGKAKRVVLLDTLVEALDPAEVEAVMAHELGHLTQRHIQKYHAARALIALCWILAFGWLTGQAGFYEGLGLSEPAPHLALALLLAISPVFGLLSRPAICAMARRFEHQADSFAVCYSDPRCLCEALIRLSCRNVTPLSADPLYAAFHHAHPSLPDRVERMLAATQTEWSHVSRQGS
jgi:STE24 endopeptidase